MRDLDKSPGNARIAFALLEVLTASGDLAARARAEQVLASEGTLGRRRADWIRVESLREAFRVAGVDASLAKRVGRALVDHAGMGMLFSYAGIATPEKAYRRSEQLLAREEPGDRFRARAIAVGRAQIEFQPARAADDPDPDPEGIFCAVRLGILEAIPPLYGLLPARVREVECRHEGAPACVYEADWQRSSRGFALTGVSLGAATGMGLAIGATTALGLATSAALWLAPAGLVVLGGLGWAAGRSVDLARQLDAVARGGLGQLAALDHVDRALAEKMDALAKLDPRHHAAASEHAERSLGSTELRRTAPEPGGDAAASARTLAGLVPRLHAAASALQRSLAALHDRAAAVATTEPEIADELRGLVDGCVEANREIHAVGVELSNAPRVRDERQRVDLAEIVRRSVSTVQLRQPASLEIEVRTEVEPAPVTGRPFQLEQIVLQLLRNAVLAVDGDGRVEVVLRTAPGGDTFELAVSDSGWGIDPELLDSALDPFFDAPAGTEETALGLASCYRIVSEHGGEMGVQSDPERGTRISVLLPAEPCGAGIGA